MDLGVLVGIARIFPDCDAHAEFVATLHGVPLRLRFAAAALAAALTAPAAVQAQTSDAPLAEGLTRAATVGAAAGWTAWSAYEAGTGYRLIVRAPDGTTGPAPVAPRKVPFDLDLGVASGSKPVAAYSRCTKEPTLVGGANATAPNYTTGTGCRVVLYDLTTQKERTLPRSNGSSSDVLPSVGGERVAFVSVTGPRKAQLRWRTLTSARAKVLDSGSRRGGTPNIAAGPANVDTDGKRVVAVWRAEDTEFNTFDSVLRVATFSGGKPRQVGYGVNGEACSYDQVLAPTLTAGGTVTYVETNGAQWVLGRTPASRQAPTFGLSRTDEAGAVVTSAAVDGTRLVIAETQSTVGRAGGATTIRQLTLGAFVRASPVTFCFG